jgi:hypothetical protein
MQKRMVFRSSVIPFPPMWLDPGSCQAVRIAAILDKPILRVEVTPEWIAMNERKQRAYERKRAEWRKQVGIVNS